MKKLVISLVVVCSLGAFAQSPPIKIGEINSYSSMPQFTTPYRQGWQLAVEEVNASGGLLGRKVEVIARGADENHANAATTSHSAEQLAELANHLRTLSERFRVA